MVTSSLLCLRACISVVAGGEHRAWCMYCAYSPVDEVVSTLAAMIVGGRMAGLMLVVDGGMGQRGIIHNPVRVHLLPQRMILLQYVIVHPILVKATLQPTLHRVTMEMRKWKARSGMMWACRAKVGRAGMSSLHVCVECTRSPFGRRVMTGLLVGRMLVRGAAVVRK
jgi:hypothetical protein